MKYNCDLIKDLLLLYQDKATSDFSSNVVEDHLNKCNECYRFYHEVKKATEIHFKTPPKTDNVGGYQSLAKRLNRAKWYWRLCIGLLLGCIISLSLMYADGNRFDPMSAAHAGNVLDENSRLLAAVPMGKERILYIYDDDGLYRDINVVYHFPFWKYNYKWPNRYIADRNLGVQLITKGSYANSINKSLYIIFAVAVNDGRVAYIELGKEGKLQRQNVDSPITVFFWDETGNWDGTSTWNGMIKDSELRGTAYASDGTVLYNLTHESNEQNPIKWIPVD
ncbi:hypothetical protein [Ruminiclostridium cellulolyticum]|uniref:Zinc-finger domain-containing protein n=1 Tax=Ruminiclostridium cellulolyticum (strain ATCC 35319 / DSM 5812 / JCM 6584 / H10) TaxID=394503 RepID=B8I6W9_RUMCH|nr:hypothetical protein [Ruminiclostridium cellulolyticum]ACL76961.1 hypothetical protein Ccel_2634 [Ruminiclostridium cellulolyticum H10]